MLARKNGENLKKDKEGNRSQKEKNVDLFVSLGQGVLLRDDGHDSQKSHQNQSHRVNDQISKFIHRLEVVLKEFFFVFYKKKSANFHAKSISIIAQNIFFVNSFSKKSNFYTIKNTCSFFSNKDCFYPTNVVECTL